MTLVQLYHHCLYISFSVKEPRPTIQACVGATDRSHQQINIVQDGQKFGEAFRPFGQYLEQSLRNAIRSGSLLATGF